MRESEKNRGEDRNQEEANELLMYKREGMYTLHRVTDTRNNTLRYFVKIFLSYNRTMSDSSKQLICESLYPVVVLSPLFSPPQSLAPLHFSLQFSHLSYPPLSSSLTSPSFFVAQRRTCNTSSLNCLETSDKSARHVFTFSISLSPLLLPMPTPRGLLLPFVVVVVAVVTTLLLLSFACVLSVPFAVVAALVGLLLLLLLLLSLLSSDVCMLAKSLFVSASKWDFNLRM